LSITEKVGTPSKPEITHRDSIPADIRGTRIVFAATKPLRSKERTVKQSALRDTAPSQNGSFRVEAKRVPEAESIIKKPQNIKMFIKAFITDANFGETQRMKSSKVSIFVRVEIFIIIYIRTPKKIPAVMIPKREPFPGRVKYSKISLPEAKPAPITSPINTAHKLRIFFTIVASLGES